MLQERPRLDVKVQELSTRLRELAIQRGPEAKLPTTRELCEIYKTNSATLNEALKELELQNIIYRKHKSGIFVSPRLHRKTICVLFFSRLFALDALSPFWTMLWAQVSQEMKRRNALGNEYFSFHLVPEPQSDLTDLQPEELPEQIIEMVMGERIHGVIAVGLEKRVFDWLGQHGILSVTFAGMGNLMLIIYAEQTIMSMVDRLVEQGCQNIGVWVPYAAPEDYQQHPGYTGWHKRLTELGLNHNLDLFRLGAPLYAASSHKIPDFQQQGYRLVHDVFAGPAQQQPDGLIITNDLMTNGALAACNELGIEVGRTVKIASLANAGSPVLATIKGKNIILAEIDVAELVQTMFSMMEQALLKQLPVTTFETYFLAPKFRTVT